MSTVKKACGRGGVIAAVLMLTMAFAAPGASASAGSEATEWLASELHSSAKGKFCESFSEAGRVGQTVDCSIAFKAAGAAFETQRKATYEYALANMAAYVGTKPCSEATSLSAGAVAKLALGVAINGGDPSNVGGRNLISDLQCLQVASGAEKGRFKDKGAFDFSNVFGQSLAVIALRSCEKVTCASKPNLKTAINNGASYLRTQQCEEHEGEGVEGAFRSSMGLAAGSCNAKTPFPSEIEFNENAVEVDSTGFAIEALITQEGAASLTAAASAGIWLTEESNPTSPPSRIHWNNYCSFTEPTVKLPSANSTALAIMGYSEIGLKITPAQEWLADAVASGTNRGLPACGATGNGDVLATAQSILGLYGVSYPTLAGV